jgi:hypothetical protein
LSIQQNSNSNNGFRAAQKTAIHRYDRPAGEFTQVRRSVYTSDLSGNAVKLLGFLLGHAPGFRLNWNWVDEQTQMAKSTRIRARTELELKGYIVYSDADRLTAWVSDQPIPTESGDTAVSAGVESIPDNTPQDLRDPQGSSETMQGSSLRSLETLPHGYRNETHGVAKRHPAGIETTPFNNSNYNTSLKDHLQDCSPDAAASWATDGNNSPSCNLGDNTPRREPESVDVGFTLSTFADVDRTVDALVSRINDLMPLTEAEACTAANIIRNAKNGPRVAAVFAASSILESRTLSPVYA